MLWTRLRIRREDEPNFRRQHPVGPYILDFYCADARLAVEVDGQGHGAEERVRHDAARDAWLGEQGITVYRVQARTVLADAAAVAEHVRGLAHQMAARPRP
jgi:very-short-patch-repair endonuclease